VTYKSILPTPKLLHRFSKQMDFTPMDVSPEPDSNLEKTRPPMAAVRYESLVDLYAAIPQLAELTQARPRPADQALNFLMRLRSSTTPEEAVTFTAFAGSQNWPSGGRTNACGCCLMRCRRWTAR
jgi:hypothetical protein